MPHPKKARLSWILPMNTCSMSLGVVKFAILTIFNVKSVHAAPKKGPPFLDTPHEHLWHVPGSEGVVKFAILTIFNVKSVHAAPKKGPPFLDTRARMAIKPGLVLDGGLTAKDRWARES